MTPPIYYGIFDTSLNLVIALLRAHVALDEPVYLQNKNVLVFDSSFSTTSIMANFIFLNGTVYVFA